MSNIFIPVLEAVFVCSPTNPPSSLETHGQFLLFAFAFDLIKHPRKVWETFAASDAACLVQRAGNSPRIPWGLSETIVRTEPTRRSRAHSAERCGRSTARSGTHRRGWSPARSLR